MSNKRRSPNVNRSISDSFSSSDNDFPVILKPNNRGKKSSKPLTISDVIFNTSNTSNTLNVSNEFTESQEQVEPKPKRKYTKRSERWNNTKKAKEEKAKEEEKLKQEAKLNEEAKIKEEATLKESLKASLKETLKEILKEEILKESALEETSSNAKETSSNVKKASSNVINDENSLSDEEWVKAGIGDRGSIDIDTESKSDDVMYMEDLDNEEEADDEEANEEETGKAEEILKTNEANADSANEANVSDSIKNMENEKSMSEGSESEDSESEDSESEDSESEDSESEDSESEGSESENSESEASNFKSSSDLNSDSASQIIVKSEPESESESEFESESELESESDSKSKVRPYFYNTGNLINDATTTSEAIKAANLDYEVIKTPLFIYSPQITKVPNQYATIRSDTKEVLGLVGKSYNILQNEEAFNFLDGFLMNREANVYLGGTYKNNSASFFIVKSDPDKILDDEYSSYILFLNSFDGSEAVKVLHTPIREATLATVSIDMMNYSNKVSIRHTDALSTRLQQAKDILNSNHGYLKELKRQSEILVRMKYTEDEFRALCDQLFKVKADKSVNSAINLSISERRMESRKEVMLRCYNHESLSNYKDTAYKALMAVADYNSHIPRFRETRNVFINMQRVVGGMEILNTVYQKILEHRI